MHAMLLLNYKRYVTIATMQLQTGVLGTLALCISLTSLKHQYDVTVVRQDIYDIIGMPCSAKFSTTLQTEILFYSKCRFLKQMITLKSFISVILLQLTKPLILNRTYGKMCA